MHSSDGVEIVGLKFVDRLHPFFSAWRRGGTHDLEILTRRAKHWQNGIIENSFTPARKNPSRFFYAGATTAGIAFIP
jgi:hypothetical protein